MNLTNEQIQALKAAAESVIQAYGDDWFGTGSQICTLLKSKVNFIAAANPGFILAFLAAHEADKALIAEQAKSIDFLKEQLAQLANFNPDWDMLEATRDSLREHMSELTAANKRIAELEARTLTVKLPPKVDTSNVPFAAHTWNAYRDEAIKALASPWSWEGKMALTKKQRAELEEIATDYGMKFQRAQDALKHQSLLHKSKMEAKDKQIADLKEAFRIALSAAGIDVATGSAKGE